MEIKELGNGAWYAIVRGAFDNHEALMAQLLAEAAPEQGTIRLYGKDVRIPRLTAWYGDEGAEYAYSGAQQTRRDWTPLLRIIRNRVDILAGPVRGLDTRVSFNSCLVNLYRNGSDSVSHHSDDEPELGPSPDDVRIASVSLGATRRFNLKHKRGEHATISLLLHGGDLLVMGGTLQQHWTHSVPKTRRPVGPRLNLTFRVVG